MKKTTWLTLAVIALAALIAFLLLTPRTSAADDEVERIATQPPVPQMATSTTMATSTPPKPKKNPQATTEAKDYHGIVPDNIADLIHCESHGRNVQIVDTNGYYSRGILQYQKSTWDDFSRESGIIGDPMVPEDAIGMTEWAVMHRLGGRWSCWEKIGAYYDEYGNPHIR